MNGIREKVLDALATIRPYLVADGGDIELIDITADYKVQVRLLGACSSCDLNYQTMRNGVEMVIKKAVPEIIGVEAVKGS